MTEEHLRDLKLLALAKTIIDGLSNQQAFPDDWYLAGLDLIEAAPSQISLD